MSDQKRIILLIFIMALISLAIGITGVSILYQTALHEEKDRLIETVKSQARLMESVARFNSKYNKDVPYSSRQATISQIMNAHEHYEGLSKTGEFTIAEKEGNEIVFLLTKQKKITQNVMRLPFDTRLAEPMRMALSGHSGQLVGLDYRGAEVLAAYEPVAELNLGIVAKIDLAEIRAPFIKAGIISGLIGMVLISLGALIFLKISNPLIKNLIESNRKLEDALSQVKLLSGLLPICASCKKIRDDKGDWNHIESYISKHSEAQFSHGICPQCMEKLYPDYYSQHVKETLHEDKVNPE